MSCTLKELKKMAKEQGIPYWSRKGKAELCKLMDMPFEGIKPCHVRLVTLCVNPTPICLTNGEEVHNFKSVYACSKHFKRNTSLFVQKKKCKKRPNEVVIKGVKYTISWATNEG